MEGHIRSACHWFSALLLACSGVGCHALHLDAPGGDRSAHPEKDSAVIQGPAAPGKHAFRIAPYVFLSDFEVPRDQPLFRELANLRDQVYKELQLPPSNTVVQVYLFEDKDRYERFIQAKYPLLPKRRAFFVAQPRAVGGAEDLLVYTYWGDRIHEDLRHELTHALLHSVLMDVPLWLDEGLAEYFEVSPELQGINSHHLEQLRNPANGPFKPDLNRLEQLTEVKDMTPAEYREAWAWVHLMLRDKAEGKVILVQYLQQLRVNPNPGKLGPRLVPVYPNLNTAVGSHLGQLRLAQAPMQAAPSPRIQ